ncbi:MAG: alpha/beta hydrolase [Lachnospiraceae bacterium]|nr:alpha/beta hydrolase [Lachnospiraceae bacterium]
MQLDRLNPEWIDTSAVILQCKTDFITRKYENISYGEEKLQELDIYLPEEEKESYPVIFNIHGGGFRYCDKHDFHLYPSLYGLQRGYAVVAVNYRLAPKARYLEQLSDIYLALQWLGKNYKEYHLDIRRVFLWGTSAGGNLALMAGCCANPGNVKAEYNVSILGIAAFCPVVDLLKLHGYGSIGEKENIKKMINSMKKDAFGTRKRKTCRMSNVQNYMAYKMKPLFLMYGGRDSLIPASEMQKFYKRAQKQLPQGHCEKLCMEEAEHAGADVDYFLESNLEPVFQFFERMQKEHKDNGK